MSTSCTLISVHKYVLLEKCQSCGWARQKCLFIIYDFLLIFLFHVTKQKAGPTWLKKKKMKEKEGNLGMVFLTSPVYIIMVYIIPNAYCGWLAGNRLSPFPVDV